MESRKIIDHMPLLSNINFTNWFLMTSFPEGIDTDEDVSLFEIISSSHIDKAWILMCCSSVGAENCVFAISSISFSLPSFCL